MNTKNSKRMMMPMHRWSDRIPKASRGLLATMTLTFAMSSQAAVERVIFPPDPSVLDLKRDFGAKGDGLADDTAAPANLEFTVTLPGALFLRDTPMVDGPTLVLDVAQTGDRWERVWGFAGD